MPNRPYEEMKAIKRVYLDILCNPEYDDWTQKATAKLLNVSDHALQRWREDFNWDEILKTRRGRMNRELPKVDSALIKKAQKGDVKAIELIYQRWDRWIPTTKQHQEFDDITGDEEKERDAIRRAIKRLLRGDVETVKQSSGEGKEPNQEN